MFKLIDKKIIAILHNFFGLTGPMTGVQSDLPVSCLQVFSQSGTICSHNHCKYTCKCWNSLQGLDLNFAYTCRFQNAFITICRFSDFFKNILLHSYVHLIYIIAQSSHSFDIFTPKM